MIQSISAEVLASSALIGVSALVILGSMVTVMRATPQRKQAALKVTVENAPYHRLLSVLPVNHR